MSAAVPNVVGLCPVHSEEFYVPHAGVCPEPGCHEAMVEYVRVCTERSDDIYESEAVELLNVLGEFDGRMWARRFIEAVKRTPEVAVDEESMVAWFASAIMVGYNRGAGVRT